MFAEELCGRNLFFLCLEPFQPLHLCPYHFILVCLSIFLLNLALLIPGNLNLSAALRRGRIFYFHRCRRPSLWVARVHQSDQPLIDFDGTSAWREASQRPFILLGRIYIGKYFVLVVFKFFMHDIVIAIWGISFLLHVGVLYDSRDVRL